MMLVLGSGPAGVAAAWALLARGLKVTMLDGGRRLEPDLQASLDRMSQQPRESWDPAGLKRFQDPVKPTAGGLPMKRTFGSDYPYQSRDHLPVDLENADILSSLAQGGLSNVWGANILPFLARDIDAWPIQLADLEPHYREVLSFVPMSGRDDALSSLFPLHTDSAHPLHLSRQAARMDEGMQRHREPLAQLGLYGGQSRLAVRVKPDGEKSGCVYCGHCLYGCPYELIYSSRHTFPTLMENPNFTYVPGRVVRKIEDEVGGVRVHAEVMSDGSREVHEGERVFVGCGTVESTRLILASREMYDETAVIRESQYFLTPLLQNKSTSAVQGEDLHTLSQLMLELIDEEVTPHSVHLLIYGYSDLFRRALEAMAGPLLPVAKLPLNWLLRRLLVIQGYLHSDISPSLRATLSKSTGVLHLQGVPNPEAEEVIRKTLGRVQKAGRYLGGRPLTFKTEITVPGKSYHAGASFPMAENPEGLQSDILGRPVGMNRTHLVDASCFTNVPATNVTLSVMANAHRIASQAGKENPSS